MSNPDSADAGKSAVPGPFWLDAKDNICEHGEKCSLIVLTPMLHEYSEPGEAARFRDLLNKGTHFDAMLEALKIAQHMMRNTNVPGGHGDGLLPAFAWDHPAMVEIRAAIAKAEGRDD